MRSLVVSGAGLYERQEQTRLYGVARPPRPCCKGDGALATSFAESPPRTPHFLCLDLHDSQASAQNITSGLLCAVSAWHRRNFTLLATSSSKVTGSKPFTSTPALSMRGRRMMSGQ